MARGANHGHNHRSSSAKEQEVCSPYGPPPGSALPLRMLSLVPRRVRLFPPSPPPPPLYGSAHDTTNFAAQGDEGLCPLCIEPLDPTEREFFPCPCGYVLWRSFTPWSPPCLLREQPMVLCCIQSHAIPLPRAQLCYELVLKWRAGTKYACSAMTGSSRIAATSARAVALNMAPRRTPSRSWRSSGRQNRPQPAANSISVSRPRLRSRHSTSDKRSRRSTGSSGSYGMGAAGQPRVAVAAAALYTLAAARTRRCSTRTGYLRLRHGSPRRRPPLALPPLLWRRGRQRRSRDRPAAAPWRHTLPASRRRLGSDLRPAGLCRREAIPGQAPSAASAQGRCRRTWPSSSGLTWALAARCKATIASEEQRSSLHRGPTSVRLLVWLPKRQCRVRSSSSSSSSKHWILKCRRRRRIGITPGLRSGRRRPVA